ncbi:MAG TPA: hypothetical protein VM165_21555 [Planctomycetaceae bacterium]|nr:hypothetical protein [Planctomycetaceae bacterium]
MPNSEITLRTLVATFQLRFRGQSGQVTSNLHHETLAAFLRSAGEAPGDLLDDQFRYGRYEGAVDALESFVLAAALAGLDVESAAFMTALETTLTALEQFI